MKITSVKAIPVTHVVHRSPVYLFEQPVSFLFVRIETDEGITGHGEVSDSYGCNYPLIARAVIDEALKPLLLGEDARDVQRLAFKMRGWTRRRLGDQGIIIQAISGLEIALWDLLGTAQGKSVNQLIGRSRNQISVYASGTFLEEGSAEWHSEFFQPCLSRGVSAIKVRMGTNFKQDLKTLHGLRSLLGDEIQIMADGGEHYKVTTALEIAAALADVGVLFFEEPIPQCNREGIRRLVEKSPVPIAYGEHLFTTHDFQDCLMHQRANVIQPDAAICGGIAEAREIAGLAETFGVPVVPHVAAGPLALAANLHFSASAANVGMLEYPFTLDRLWKEMLQDPVLSPPALHEGSLQVPNGPGLGLTINEDVWDKYPYQPFPPVSKMPVSSLGYI